VSFVVNAFRLSLNRKQERLFECFRNPAQEAGGVGTVD
jgi:hypothetical protein